MVCSARLRQLKRCSESQGISAMNEVSQAAFTTENYPTIELVPLASLRPNPRNARIHSKKQVRQVAESIAATGIMDPIVVTDDNMILSGHGRAAAAKRAGWQIVPILRFSGLTEAQRRAYVIAANRVAECAGWDRDLLSIELGELSELLPKEGLEISLTGFEVAEVDALLADFAAGPTSEEPIPPMPQTPVSHGDDLWRLQKHRLLCADTRIEEKMQRLMDGRVADMVICDPPYNVRLARVVGRGKVRHPEFAVASGEMSVAQYRKFLLSTIGNAARVSRDGGLHYIFSDWRHFPDLAAVGEKLFGEMLNLVVWAKSTPALGSFYRSQHELIGVFRVGQGKHRNNVELGRFGRNRSNLWTYAGVNSFGKGRMEAIESHPTPKPVALVADAILDCTARGDIVVDQFLGSGTTLLAAEKVGRVCFGMEYEPKYVDVAIERWQRFTNMEAVLDGDGRTFEEIRAVRAVKVES